MNMFCCVWGKETTKLESRVVLHFLVFLVCPAYENDIETTQHLQVQKTCTVASKKIQPHTKVGSRHHVKFYMNVCLLVKKYTLACSTLKKGIIMEIIYLKIYS